MADEFDKGSGPSYPEPRYDAGPLSKATSRRQFIKGVIWSGAAVSGSGYLLQLAGCSREQGSVGGVERMLMRNVNGQTRPVDVLPNETLAMTLRYELGLTGTKLGCDRGECGACTVMVDDVATYACSTLTHAVRGRDLADSTALQVRLQRLLGLPAPSYRHHLLLLEERGEKLAKLHGAVGAPELRRVYSGAELCGVLAHLAGLLDAPEPTTPRALLADFSWERVAREDRVVRWTGEQLELVCCAA